MSQVDERMGKAGKATGHEREPGRPPPGFRQGEHVLVREVDHDDKNWRVVGPLSYTGNQKTFRVPPDMLTDFASVPRPLVWFLPRYGKYTKAAIVHDYLWRTAVPSGELPRRDADALFRRAMQELDVAFLRRWFMWAAVRVGALSKKDGRKGWWKDAWRVLLLSLLALPIVAPPAVLVLLALVVFFLVELIFYGFLKITRFVKPPKEHERRRKLVNRPKLQIKL
jgi:uncharacterized protein DUF1353